jgi:hypothetical protein
MGDKNNTKSFAATEINTGCKSNAVTYVGSMRIFVRAGRQLKVYDALAVVLPNYVSPNDNSWKRLLAEHLETWVSRL